MLDDDSWRNFLIQSSTDPFHWLSNIHWFLMWNYCGSCRSCRRLFLGRCWVCKLLKPKVTLTDQYLGIFALRSFLKVIKLSSFDPIRSKWVLICRFFLEVQTSKIFWIYWWLLNSSSLSVSNGVFPLLRSYWSNSLVQLFSALFQVLRYKMKLFIKLQNAIFLVENFVQILRFLFLPKISVLLLKLRTTSIFLRQYNIVLLNLQIELSRLSHQISVR